MTTEPLHQLTADELGQVAPPIVRPSVKLHSGDRMSREEFHRLYEQTPEDFKAELIGGTVYVASPVSPSHGKPHLLFAGLLAAYVGRTPGVEASDNTTIFLGDEGELQPDLYLRILPQCGGQSTTKKNGYVEGAPELVSEIAYSSRAIDLHAKKDEYARYGVREYLVVSVEEQQLRWFDLLGGTELRPDPAGIYRIQAFPGLWINGPALIAHDYNSLMQTLEEGLATPEHAAFVTELAKRRAKE
jgi:Uma2 family endonuclease